MKTAPFEMKDLQQIFQNFKQLHILVVGDLILDRYIWGAVERISPEAPVPVVHVQRREFRVGGAGNVAANLSALNCRVSLAGVVGQDEFQSQLNTLFKKSKITPLLVKEANRLTTVKTRIIAKRQQLLRFDEEETRDMETAVLDKLMDLINPHLDQFDGIILSDYNKGLLVEDLIQTLRQKWGNKPLIIDPKGFDYQKYRGATAIKPNFDEFRTAINHPHLTQTELGPYAKQLMRELELEGVVITLGEDGVFIYDKKDKSLLIPTDAREVYDVSGAGDTFIAAFAAALIISGNWFMAAKAGNLAAGVAVGKLGTATVTQTEIFNHLN